ncbi:MAG: FtsK/SpoIIIE domain-containing protein [Bacteriovorax sp.]|nr:FtsK/SpoIIIE domain-containing protein [Bacteriovorax sp.]
MNNKNKATSGSDGLEKFGLAIATIVGITSIVAWTGLRKIKIKSEEFICLFPTILFSLFLISYSDYAYLRWLKKILPTYFTKNVVLFLRTIPKVWHFSILIIFTLYTIGILLGFKAYFRRRKLQKDLDTTGLTNAQGQMPKVISEVEIDENRSKVLVTAKGIGCDRFEAKKGDLQSSFGRIIESIKVLSDQTTLEILMCKNALRKILTYHEAETALKNPYNFLIGESANGILVADIRELPHLLIAGSTGGGKSVFFRQFFMSLLKYSSHLQVYLIDLKLGIEVKEFGQIPNVRIAKDEMEAVQLLQAIRDEMHKRFIFMEKIGIKKIDPKLHKRDLIVVGIDEASVLFGKTTVSKAKSELVARARELTDEIAKLARAAGIHLVIATQKPLKESLDTKTLENLTGRMIFQMSTITGSVSALGNKKAYALPEIQGRAIWAGGNKYIEVQTPFLSETQFDEECKELAAKMKEDGLKNFQPMIEYKAPKTEGTNPVVSMAVSSSEATT